MNTKTKVHNLLLAGEVIYHWHGSKTATTSSGIKIQIKELRTIPGIIKEAGFNKGSRCTTHRINNG